MSTFSFKPNRFVDIKKGLNIFSGTLSYIWNKIKPISYFKIYHSPLFFSLVLNNTATLYRHFTYYIDRQEYETLEYFTSYFSHVNFRIRYLGLSRKNAGTQIRIIVKITLSYDFIGIVWHRPNSRKMV